MKTRSAFFTRELMGWDKASNTRVMPWKGEKNPYRVWLSEIILQQTRVEQGWAYYEKFVEAFPAVEDLAAAPEQQVFKLWEGLGYYTRCKNLLAAAKKISEAGKFPADYESILGLPGVGPYTAAAIASFAYDLPYAVVDGNVFRVLSRYFGMPDPIDSTAGKKKFTALAASLLDKKAPGAYNQAIMDFGAVICKPQSPLCTQCPLAKKCVAFENGIQDQLPVKEKKIIKKERWFNYFVCSYRGDVYVRKRGIKDIWENLYEFVLFETASQLEPRELLELPEVQQVTGRQDINAVSASGIYRQTLTHQYINGRFIKLELKKPLTLEGYERVSPAELLLLPFPKLISNYLGGQQAAFLF